MYNLLISLPSSMALSYWWNFGSFLGLSLVMQIISGLLLLLNFNTLEPYEAIMFIMYEVHYGWFLKLFHSNNASVIFALLYGHLFKNMTMSSYRLAPVWYSGLIMMVLIMGAGFTGYVLVNSQMSFWAAMVITSLIGVLPFVGEILMYFVWGGYSLSWVTLQLLFVVHFILPFLVMVVMIYHLIALHITGSTSLIYSHSGLEKIPFFPYYWVKDMVNIPLYMLFVVGMLLYPYSLGEVELFEEANSLVSPVHIVPEWYYLWFYAILRSVPSKPAGVMIMGLSIGVFFLYPYFSGYITPAGVMMESLCWALLSNLIVLTFLGSCPISEPYISMALLSVFFYFLIHLLHLMFLYLSNVLFD